MVSGSEDWVWLASRLPMLCRRIAWPWWITPKLIEGVWDISFIFAISGVLAQRRWRVGPKLLELSILDVSIAARWCFDLRLLGQRL